MKTTREQHSHEWNKTTTAVTVAVLPRCKFATRHGSSKLGLINIYEYDTTFKGI